MVTYSTFLGHHDHLAMLDCYSGTYHYGTTTYNLKGVVFPPTSLSNLFDLSLLACPPRCLRQVGTIKHTRCAASQGQLAAKSHSALLAVPCRLAKKPPTQRPHQLPISGDLQNRVEHRCPSAPRGHEFLLPGPSGHRIGLS